MEKTSQDPSSCLTLALYPRFDQDFEVFILSYKSTTERIYITLLLHVLVAVSVVTGTSLPLSASVGLRNGMQKCLALCVVVCGFVTGFVLFCSSNVYWLLGTSYAMNACLTETGHAIQSMCHM
eukprot:4647114-Amphidinium_carterae.1